MNLKEIPKNISNLKWSLQEKMFILFTFLGSFGVLGGVIGGLSANLTRKYLVFIVGLCILVIGIFCWSLKFHKIPLGSSIMGVIVIFFMMPASFMVAGGIYSGGPLWCLFGLMYVSLNVYSKFKYVLMGCWAAVTGICFFIAYSYPERMFHYTEDKIFMGYVIAVVFVSAFTLLMILFQTELYRGENRIVQKQKKEIEELNKAQNRFFSTMSHEIRTPINTIIGLNEMIMRENISDEVAEDARNIQGASRMLLTLINDILDMSKIESGSMDIVPVDYDLGEMLSDIVNMIWVMAKKKGLEFHVSIDEKIPSKLHGDEVRIKQILINILNNAIKYTSEGSVTLSIQCEKLPKDRINIIYSVTDTGMGIKKESLPYLFSVFKRVDEEKNRYIEGTGLGLSIVKQLIELMGGSIKVNSIYTKGSTFIVTLPQEIAEKTQIGKLDLEAKRDMGSGRSYRQSFEAPEASVLIVDDNEMNLMVAEKLLRDTKVRVKTVTSGEECLKETARTKWDVIFMDHIMPQMDGIQCLRAIRKQRENLNTLTPVVILTANAGGEDRALYEREGFDGYLLKPVNGRQLEAELLRHLPGELVNVIYDGQMEDASDMVFVHKSKVPVMITTDSVCDLPADLVEKYRIAVLPYHVCTGGGDFMEEVEVETDGLLSYMESEGKTAHSESPKVSEYEDFFAEGLTNAQHIIHISMGRKSSYGYHNACEAAENFDNVQVIDSGHLSSGMGMIVLRTAEYAAERKHTVEEIADFVQYMKKRVSTTFMIENTEYLARSGRLSWKASNFCKAFMIFPKLSMRNSKIALAGILAGSREGRWKRYIDGVLRNKKAIDPKLLFITYVDLSDEDLQEIEKEVLRKVPFEKIICYQATSAIAINCGRGTFGLLFAKK